RIRRCIKLKFVETKMVYQRRGRKSWLHELAERRMNCNKIALNRLRKIVELQDSFQVSHQL
ncbi:MAG: hypothetical protein ABUT20_42710, partial [Bacteroidota bacterium]